MSSAITLNEKKLKAAAKRLPQELTQAGVDVSNLGYAKALDILSKSLFGKPYTEAKATLLAAVELSESDAPEDPFHAVVEIVHGSNIILAVDGVYFTATNPGTDMEIPYFALSARAADEAARYGVGVRNADLTGLCQNADSDDEIVAMAERMGYFRPEGSIFEEIESADLILVDGKANEIRLYLNWKELVEMSDYPEGEVIWMTRTVGEADDEPVICNFSFEDLCDAWKNGDSWTIKASGDQDYDGTPTHRITFKTVSAN